MQGALSITRRCCPLMREKIVKSRYIGFSFFFLLCVHTYIRPVLYSLNCFILLYYSSAFFQLRWLINPFDCARHRRACRCFKHAYVFFSCPYNARRKRNILSDGIYAFLWNMFKIFKTCLAKGITATKEHGTRAVVATLLFVRRREDSGIGINMGSGVRFHWGRTGVSR